MQETRIKQLKINKMSQEQYDEAKALGTLNPNEFYLTPGDSAPGIFVCTYGITEEQEIVNAYNDDKSIYCKYMVGTSQLILSLSYHDRSSTSETFAFGCTYLGEVYDIQMVDGEWMEPTIYATLSDSEIEDLSEWASLGKSASDKLDYLVPYMKGQEWSFETVNSTVGSGSIPNGAKMASIESFGGQTVMWNQPLSTATKTTQGLTWTWDSSRNKFHIQGTSPSYGYSTFSLLTPIATHKYYIYIDSDEYVPYGFVNAQPSSSLYYYPSIWTCSSSTGNKFGIKTISTSKSYDFYALTFVVDLTIMFGLGNEPTTVSDPRIQWINNYVTNSSTLSYITSGTSQRLNFPVSSISIGNSISTIPQQVMELNGYGLGTTVFCNTVERVPYGWNYVQRLEEDPDGNLPIVLDTPITTDITDYMNSIDMVEPCTSTSKIQFGTTTVEDSPVPCKIEYAIYLEEAL